MCPLQAAAAHKKALVELQEATAATVSAASAPASAEQRLAKLRAQKRQTQLE